MLLPWAILKFYKKKHVKCMFCILSNKVRLDQKKTYKNFKKMEFTCN